MVLDVSKGKVSLREQPRRLEIGDLVPDFTMTTQDGKVAEALRPARQCGCTYVYLYAMSAS